MQPHIIPIFSCKIVCSVRWVFFFSKERVAWRVLPTCFSLTRFPSLWGRHRLVHSTTLADGQRPVTRAGDATVPHRHRQALPQSPTHRPCHSPPQTAASLADLHTAPGTQPMGEAGGLEDFRFRWTSGRDHQVQGKSSAILGWRKRRRTKEVSDLTDENPNKQSKLSPFLPDYPPPVSLCGWVFHCVEHSVQYRPADDGERESVGWGGELLENEQRGAMLPCPHHTRTAPGLPSLSHSSSFSPSSLPVLLPPQHETRQHVSHASTLSAVTI